jgi:adenosylmethionine-8-amino-7-oxononanoate aminotransferase
MTTSVTGLEAVGSDAARYPLLPGAAPLRAVRTEGRHVILDDGRRILDAGGGAIVANIGYGRAEIAGVAARAMEQITFVLPTWATDARTALVQRVVDQWMPDGITRAQFTSGGSESVDTALRLARQHHVSAGRDSRWRVIGRRPSYHGATVATLGVGGHDARRAPFEPMFTGFAHVPWDDAEALDATIRELGADSVAAFIAEPVVGSSAGCLVADQTYWDRVQEICREHGVLLIIDEVMTGFGRTGRRMGTDHYDIRPDLVVGGKGLAGGYAAIGGVFASDEVVAPIAAAGDSFMFFTYGAQDVACAVADAVLRTIDDEDLVARADAQGAALRSRLEARFAEHPHVGEVRGLGLMLGVTLVADRDGPELFPLEDGVHRAVMAEALRRDVWIYPASSGPAAPDAMMFGPAFTVTDDELDTMVDVLAQSIDAVVSARA